MSDVLVRCHGGAGLLSLDRPGSIHALTQAMCQHLSQALVNWRADDGVQAVMIDHASGRGFCAGGDVAMARQSALEDGGAAARAFFHAEYRLNHLLFTYAKPVVTFMDGVTMGGGAGIALPARYRVATENTLFAVPQCGIGLFPDIGAGWYLPRLPGQIGKFLALTGARLDGAECLWAGLATHYLPTGKLAEAKTRIAAEPAQIDAILADLSASPPPARLARNADAIAQLFAADTAEGILSALAADPSKWAGKEFKAVAAKCPVSVKVALRLFAADARLADFAAQMRQDYRLAARMVMRPDYGEGVRALLIDRDNTPHWQPARPEDVTEAMIDAIFAALPEGEEWSAYPYKSAP